MIPVTSAIANPTILLESPNFTRMLEYCAEHFAYVLVDTPPLGNVADALNIARHCDGSVLVVHGGDTPPQAGAQFGAAAEAHGYPAFGGGAQPRRSR